MINVNDFKLLTDSETFDNAIKNRTDDGIIIIPPRKSDIEPERNYWLIDKAILIPENTTVILQNCKIKLSDKCRDNFFRSANCGLGIDYPEEIHNIHIKGEGVCILEGADHPRAVGDSSKTIVCPCPHEAEDLSLYGYWIPEERRKSKEFAFMDVHGVSYGTDAGKDGESQLGDWRGIGILFANAVDFSISGVKIVESHCWGISLEACSYGKIEDISFDAHMEKIIDGMKQHMENQDGIDIRNGCHHITISNITGRTGDDFIALTAIADPVFHKGGSLGQTHVMHNDWSIRESDIHDIIINNVVGYSNLGDTVRLLPANTKIYNVVINNIIDTNTRPFLVGNTIQFGEPDGAYGKNYPESLEGITVSNVICQSYKAIINLGYMKNCAISNVVNKNPNCAAIQVCRKGGFDNVTLSNISSAGEILEEL